MRIKLDISIKASPIVQRFVFANFVLFAGWGFITPVFAVFVLNEIAEATLITVGIVTAIFFITKAVIQIPIANFLDATKGEHDDFHTAMIGTLLIAAAAFVFTLVKTAPQLYVVQFIHAIGFGMYIPAWMGMFSRHHDANRDSLDWALSSTAVGIATGISGAIGGVIGANFGFNALWIMVAGFSLLTTVLLLAIPKLIFPASVKKPSKIPPTYLHHP
jgi:MFS family permease